MVMTFRLGYVAMNLHLEDCSPSGTVTFYHLNKMEEKARLIKLRQVTKKNLENTLRILKYNKAMEIKVYRLTSKLVPLATHPALKNWDYASDFEHEFKAIGDFIKENDFRVSAHPDHFTLLNAPDPRILEASIRDLNYHVRIFEAMGLAQDRYKLVLHVGGLYKNKAESMKRFMENFLNLEASIRKRIILENDDKSYTAQDVLTLCRSLKIPMVIDIHHFQCINDGEDLSQVLPAAFDTWTREDFPPKVHFSSPKSEKAFRSHADLIDVSAFLDFLMVARETGKDFDVMLEAKSKNQALIHLSDALSRQDFLERVNLGEFRFK